MSIRILDRVLAFTSLVLLGGAACGGPASSSSTHWFACSEDADCADVPGATECREGYCVDAAGNRVTSDPASGSGGTTGTGGAGASTSGGASSGGSSTGGTTSTGGSSDADVCDFVDDYRECTTNEECVPVAHMSDCCGTQTVPAINSANQAAFDTEEAECRTVYPACECLTEPTRADDGRFVGWDLSSLDHVSAECVEGQCRSFVTAAPCGPDVSCQVDELCVAYTTTVPETSTSYECLTNPCSGEVACSCAQSLCDARTDTTRICTVGVGEYDVYCEDTRQ